MNRWCYVGDSVLRYSVDNFGKSTDFNRFGVAPSTTEDQSRCLRLMN